ncbi:MAG: porphobilinogen synthase [Brevinematia bacterium]
MLRRLRSSKNIRDLISEVKLNIDDFVAPFFVVDGVGVVEEIKSFPGVYRYSVDKLVLEVKKLVDKGIKGILLFGVIDEHLKDDIGSYSIREDNVVCRAVKSIKDNLDVVVAVDVCLCGYTSHGHCGIVVDGRIDNDKTIDVLSKIALNYAKAGADILAPSAMADFQVRKIRQVLDENGFKDRIIMSYSAKYSSNFYGPFRDIANSSPKFGDRKMYQMDFRNIRQALIEVERDIQEGADIVMIKPSLSYLDVIREVRNHFNVPIAAYNVSGEYSIIKISSREGIVNEKEVAIEILTSIKRAGADLIISYWAKDVVDWINSF